MDIYLKIYKNNKKGGVPFFYLAKQVQWNMWRRFMNLLKIGYDYFLKRTIKKIEESDYPKLADIPKHFYYEKSMVMALVNKDGKFIKDFPWFLNDVDVVKAAVSNTVLAVFDIGDDMKDNEDVMRIACKKDPRILLSASDKLQNNKEFLELLENFVNWEKELYKDLIIYEDKNPLEKVEQSQIFKNWYKERMEILQKYKDEENMKEIFEENSNIKKTRALKF
jgi:hypothetical protein